MRKKAASRKLTAFLTRSQNTPNVFYLNDLFREVNTIHNIDKS